MIELKSVNKSFGGREILRNVSFRVEKGKKMVLLGPSGCGKTTILRLIAGFEKPDTGAIFLNGTDADGRAPRKRNIGLVFQDLALWPHMSIKDNISFCLKDSAYTLKKKGEKICELLDLVGMTKHIGCYPAQLSGGEQQRAALARALASKPEILLLDEPLSDLDLMLREELQGVIIDLQKKLNITVLLVTHNQDEAFIMADSITVIKEGKVEQSAPADEIRRRPATEFVKRFLRL
ncbi:MAG: ABC transporter ATP-binding protein [Candidatus Omnitrophota bacterium]|jgi:putative spermidine/putrescine transport system ATP-binding protein